MRATDRCGCIRRREFLFLRSIVHLRQQGFMFASRTGIRPGSSSSPHRYPKLDIRIRLIVKQASKRIHDRLRNELSRTRHGTVSAAEPSPSSFRAFPCGARRRKSVGGRGSRGRQISVEAQPCSCWGTCAGGNGTSQGKAIVCADLWSVVEQGISTGEALVNGGELGRILNCIGMPHLCHPQLTVFELKT